MPDIPAGVGTADNDRKAEAAGRVDSELRGKLAVNSTEDQSIPKKNVSFSPSAWDLSRAEIAASRLTRLFYRNRRPLAQVFLMSRLIANWLAMIAVSGFPVSGFSFLRQGGVGGGGEPPVKISQPAGRACSNLNSTRL